MDRRTFLKGTATLAAGGGVLGASAPLSPVWAAAQQPSDIRNYQPGMRYRPHGLTGVSVSALGFGMLRLPMLADGKTVDEAQVIRMVRHAVDTGLNYVDTGYVYLGGQRRQEKQRRPALVHARREQQPAQRARDTDERRRRYHQPALP